MWDTERKRDRDRDRDRETKNTKREHRLLLLEGVGHEVRALRERPVHRCDERV